MNSIYRYLGIEKSIINLEVPASTVLENASEKDRENFGWALANVDSICLKLSAEKDDENLLVFEVVLNTPKNIEEISRLLQRTIKHKILFIFEYQARYLVMWRNFKITDSTEYVYTDNTTYCTDWIYEEELSPDVIWSCATTEIDFGSPAQRRLKKLILSKGKKSITTYFSDILKNVVLVNRSVILSDLISYRHFVDWYNTHILGRKVDFLDAVKEADKANIVSLIDEHMFFDKSQLSFICSELKHSFFITKIGRTGRIPMLYFEDVASVATFEQESDFIFNYNFRKFIQEQSYGDDVADFRPIG